MSAHLNRLLPVVSGQLDRDYVDAALARAGLAATDGPIEIEPLLGGRTGGSVQRIRSGPRSLVVKWVVEDSWRISGMKSGGEALLWACGLLRDLPGPIDCPVVDVGYEVTARRYWVLMEDVGRHIRERGAYTRSDSKRLCEALAQMQARHDQETLRDAPLPPVSGPTNSFRLPLLHLSGKAPQTIDWVPSMLADFTVMGACLPAFLEALGASLADAFLDLVADDEWVRMLDAEPPTLLHGDLRRANIAMCSGSIGLFDWEFAARGPAGCDLQWHNLLHYWAYPPDGVEPGDDCDDLAELYVQRLSEELGGSVDRAAFDRGWKLGWLKAMAQLGYVLADPLVPGGADADTSERVRRICQRAVRRAVDMRAAL